MEKGRFSDVRFVRSSLMLTNVKNVDFQDHNMGEVILVFRVLPEDMEHFEQIRKDLESLKPERLEEEPIAFGLKAFKFTTIVEDAGGTADKVEADLNAIKNVKNVETIAVSRGF